MDILRRFTDFILKKRLHAMLVAFLLTYVPLIDSVGVLIVGLVTLRKGGVEGGLVLIAAILPYFLSYFTLQPGDQSVEVFILFGVIVASKLLVWLFALLLRRFSNWGLLIDFAILLGIVTVGLIHLVYPEVSDWWALQFKLYFEKMTTMSGAAPKVLPPELEAKVINNVKNYANGFMVATILLYTLLQVVFARWWQAILFNPGGLRKELYDIRLSHVTGALFVIIFALSFVSMIAKDMTPVLYALFGVAGLSLIHCFLAPVRRGWIWLLLFYVSAIWLFPVNLIAIAVIAWLDVWMDFRKRFIQQAR